MADNDGRYVLAAKMPDGRIIRGAKRHTTMQAVHDQLRRTAPQWRIVFPGVQFDIAEAEADA